MTNLREFALDKLLKGKKAKVEKETVINKVKKVVSKVKKGK